MAKPGRVSNSIDHDTPTVQWTVTGAHPFRSMPLFGFYGPSAGVSAGNDRVNFVTLATRAKPVRPYR